MHIHATQSTACSRSVATAHHPEQRVLGAMHPAETPTERLLRLRLETTASPHRRRLSHAWCTEVPRGNQGALVVLALAAFFGAAVAAGAAGASAAVGLGVMVEQRAWNSALALVS